VESRFKHARNVAGGRLGTAHPNPRHRRPLTRERSEGARMSGRFYALKPASLDAISRKPARADLRARLSRLRAAFAARGLGGRDREHAALVALSERQLLDVGLLRSEVAAAHDRVFWRI